ncbi:ATP-binding protein [Streptomyces sp. NPDC102278]|uniref:ATP-binding protein n=1 Tax=Streptomyces sp. NPDC102278 TaxID=3366152 RepID=UPI003816DCC0
MAFLQLLCRDEITRRETSTVQRRLTRAEFEQKITLEEFDFTASSKLPAAQILSLEALAAPLRRVDQPVRPAGLKRHVAHALGHLTVRQRAHVRLAKINQLPADFVGGHADRTWDKRSVNWHGPTCSPLTG